MSNFVLTPLSKTELRGFFDDDALKVIEFFLRKSMVAQPEKLRGQEDIPIQVPKEHIEQWVVQALGVKPIGSGSYPVDVITTDWGADVKMLSCDLDKNGNLKNADSGETSLAQKFQDEESVNLDSLFEQRKLKVIWEKWKKVLVAKYKRVEVDYGVDDIYYFIILRAGSLFHLCGLHVDLSNISDVEVNEIRSTYKSVWVKNFIQDEFGHTKVYKSKKRLELRLKPKKWVEDNLVITFDTDFKQTSANIRKKIANNELDNYIDDVLVPLIKQ